MYEVAARSHGRPPGRRRGRRTGELRAHDQLGRNRPESALDILSRFVSDDLACFHEIERGEAMLGGRTEPETFALRVTSVYRREDGHWRIVLRHADPILAPRPVDATLSG